MSWSGINRKAKPRYLSRRFDIRNARKYPKNREQKVSISAQHFETRFNTFDTLIYGLNPTYLKKMGGIPIIKAKSICV